MDPVKNEDNVVVKNEGNVVFKNEGNVVAGETLPPPQPVSEEVWEPVLLDKWSSWKPVNMLMRVPMRRCRLANRGQKAKLLTNHFYVNASYTDGFFFHYSVALFYEDGRPVEGKGVGRKVLDRVRETYNSELAGKEFAYDGKKSLFTVSALPRNKLEFTVILEDVTYSRNNNGKTSPEHEDNDRKRMRRHTQSKTFKVELSFVAKIPMHVLEAMEYNGVSVYTKEALRVIDIILRQHAANQGCLLVRQSFFHNDPKSFYDVGGGVLGCRGFHSSFHASQGGLFLNMDVFTTMIIQPGPVLDFLINNQNVKDPCSIDWAKAKRTLKNLRVKASPTNTKYKITGLSEKPCNQQLFLLKRSSLVEKSRQKPEERMQVLSDALKLNNYNADPLLKSCGISINSNFTQVEGLVLQAPMLKAGNGQEFFAINGRWNFNSKKLVEPTKIERWAVVNFSAQCNIHSLVKDLIKCGRLKGMKIDDPFNVFEESPQNRRIHLWLESRKCLTSLSQTFLVLHSFFCAYCLRGKILSFMVHGSASVL